LKDNGAGVFWVPASKRRLEREGNRS